MDHGLMHGMLWAGVLLSSIPVLLALGIGVFVLYRYRLQRTRMSEAPERSADGSRRST